MRYRYKAGEKTYDVHLERIGQRYRVTIEGTSYDVEVLDSQPGAFSLNLGDQSGTLRAETVYWGGDSDVKWLSLRGCTYRLERPKARRAGGSAGGGPGDSVRAPMPATVRLVKVAEGEAVEAGETLMVLEAMKMEIRLPAPRSGRVARLLAKAGEPVEREQVLVELEGKAEADGRGGRDSDVK